MFSYSGLTAAQMQRLRSEFAVYGVDSGRICVAALNEGNLPGRCWCDGGRTEGLIGLSHQESAQDWRFHPPIQCCSAQCRERFLAPSGPSGSLPRPAMLYQLFETQRALLSPFSEFAAASAKLYSHPLSPFTHTPMAQRLSAGLDLMHRLAKDYREARVRHQVGRSRRCGRGRAGARGAGKALLPPAALQALHGRPRSVLAKMKDQPTVLVVAPLSGHHSTLLRETVKQLLKDPQGLHHRLDRRAHGAAGRRRLPSGRLHRLRAGVHPPRRRRGQPRHLGLPAHRARAGCHLADGQRRRGHAAQHDHDGRPHRRPQRARRPSTTWP